MDDNFTMKSSRNKVSPEDGKSEVYTIYNSSLEEVRDMDRALCQEDDKSVNNNNIEKERGEEREVNLQRVQIFDILEMEKRGMRGLFQINPVTKTGQRLYMVHMLLLPFLPITALIIQNSTTLNELLQYQTEVQRIGDKVETATFLERFITNMQRERSEVAFHIFTNGTQTLGLNLTDRFKITDEAFEKMTWPNIKQSENTEMFKSKLRYQVSFQLVQFYISYLNIDIIDKTRGL